MAEEKAVEAASIVAQKKKKGKKRKISKHIAAAAAAPSTTTTTADSRGETTVVVSAPAATKTAASGEKRNKKRKLLVKDPAEAAAYLTSWQEHRQHRSNGDGSGVEKSTNWKFNKNTQSWLIRHMYEADKVSKGNFALLLEYLKSGDGKTVQRCREEATRRALRYQQFQKESDVTKNSASEAAVMEDDERWNKLDEHGKRKEYKRARKVLDILNLGQDD